MKKKSKSYLFLLSLALVLKVEAKEITPAVIVQQEQVDLSNITPYETSKVENVSPLKLNSPVRQTLSDVVSDQVGVESQTYCSNCGAKRLTINGLKAEYTSILVDGLPLHSAVSSFYGVDSIPVNGISDVEVMRGAGASLTNPEAIGGTINITSKDPLQKEQDYRTSLSLNDEGASSAQNHSLFFSMPSKSKKLGLILGAQFSELEPWDEDDNGVAESASRRNSSAMAKVRFLPNAQNDFRLRASYSHLTILGGATNATRPHSFRTAEVNQNDFIDGNIENEYIGDKNKITDWIDLKRYETTLHWTKYIDAQTTLRWNQGFARQEQRSIYQHGFDYANNDNIFVSDFSLENIRSEKLILTAGLFYKYQRLRSSSEKLFEQKGLPHDDFDNSSFASYLNFSFITSDDLEMDFALRADFVTINWLDLSNRIYEPILAPRYQVRHNISDHLSQRFSYGLGYRTPLTFFESQHGNNENGYIIDIKELEKAHSLVYSLSYNTPTYYITLGSHYTLLDNMAYGFESEGQEIEYINSSEQYQIWANDLLLGHKLSSSWLIEASFELFEYENSYTRKLPTAAIEERFQLRSTFEKDKWTHNVQMSLVGARDLFRYGNYRDHYIDRKQFPSPERRGDKRKNRYAPAFITLDTSFAYTYNKSYEFTLGVNNLLDETQLKYGDGPSAWHWHFTHAHYDGLHTWGPNRGREFYIQLRMHL